MSRFKTKIMEPKILIIAVNYNSYKELYAYLQSIEEAVANMAIDCEVEVYVADNSLVKSEIDKQSYHNFELNIVSLDNMGYFGAAFYVVNNLVCIDQYKYVIISNVDISLERDCLQKLLCLNIPNHVVWLSPYRYSEKYDMPLCVERDKRIPKWKILLFLLVYKFYLFQIIQSYFTIHKYKNKRIYPFTKRIYSGCGSCFILTSYFFKYYPKLSYPVFLYGEEIFLAELLREKGLEAYYVPSVKIRNIGSVSTGLLGKKKLCLYNYKAIKYLYYRFYK